MWRSLFILLPALTTCQLWTQSHLDNLAQTLEVKWRVKDNLEFERKYFAVVTLTNRATLTLNKNGGWSIFLNCIRMIEPDVLPRPEGVVLEGQGVKVTHYQGSLFSIEPTEDFLPLRPDASRKIQFYVKIWQVARTSVMPNWYFDVPGLVPKVIESTVGEELSFVESFIKPQQVKRYDFDKYSPFTAQERYRRNHLDDTSDDGEIRVIPKPLTVAVDKNSSVVVDTTWRVYATNDLANEATYFMNMANIQSGGPELENDVIRMSTGNVDVNEGGIAGHSDNYRLTVDTVNRVIDIIGQGSSGVFYGVQTLLSLMSQREGRIYKLEITDSPRYPYRGMHFDVGRNFHPKDEVIRFLRHIAIYKLNRLHFHLSEDEGWRLEIPGLEELTTVGSKRCHDLNETSCLFPQIGSGPTQSTSGSGFYSTAQYREILQEANRLHIHVIPEFDMPGHAHAAIKSMEARFKRLQAAGQEAEGRKYLLVEEGDTSSYITPQMFTDNAMNPCMESTYTFIDHVIRELVRMHEGVQPLKVYHYGGDEVGKGAWINSTLCKTLFNSNTVSTAQVKEYFFTRVSDITVRRNLNMAAWEDGLVREGNEVFNRTLAKNAEVTAYSWDNVWEVGTAGRAYDMANEGYTVVMNHATHLYFDHPYEPDPEERGYYWATRFTDTKKAFSFTPENLYSLINVKRSGETITRAEACGENDENCPPLQNSENIIGLQGCLWSETARTRDHIDSQLFPRIFSLAERAWHRASWENETQTEAGMEGRKADWESFARHIGHFEFHRLDTQGIKYRVPPPGAEVENGFLKFTSTYPGLTVELSKDGGKTWYRANNNVLVTPTQEIHLRTRSTERSRFSRVVSLYGTEPLPMVDQRTIDYMAENVSIKYKVLDNFQDGTVTFLAQVTLRNNGQRDVVAGNWGIYFCSIYMVPQHQPGLIEDITINHVKGCLFKMEPTSKFRPLRPNDERIIKFRAEYRSVSKSDTMPNWYFWAEGMRGKTISSTEGSGVDFVEDFTTPRQWKQYNTTKTQDRYDPYTPAQRYSMSEDIPDLGSAQHAIVPTPVTMVTDQALEPLMMTSLTVIVTEPSFEAEAQFLKDELSKGGYSSITVSTSPPPLSAYIQLLNRDPRVIINNEISTSPEAYSLMVDPVANVISIWSTTQPGIFNGVQSLLSLVLKSQTDGNIPKMTVEDAPRFEYRGMHLDVARNFHSKESVLMLLDAMAMYKLNKFHFHVTDNEGWRVEIPGLQELTKVGGQRCHDIPEEKCIISQLGSGPDTTTSGSGFYTVDDYKDIIRYAKARHIEVIPEIDSPGHAHAVISALKARRQRLLDAGDFANADMYTLFDVNDESDYISTFMFKDNAINPCVPSTYTFFSYIIDQFIQLHKDINPLRTFHFGGDEVAKGAWLYSPACQSLLSANVSLKEYFTQSIANITYFRGLNLGGWEDGLMQSVSVPYKRSLLNNKDVLAYAWNNVWEYGGAKRTYLLANSGYKVVLSHATHLYFDHPHEPDSEEWGYFWATRFTDTYKTFGYIADNLYNNVDYRLNGDPMTKDVLCGEDGSKCVPLQKPENIIGIQGQLWSETIRTKDQLFHMIFPRLIALAERAWHKAPWEVTFDMKSKRDEWKTFANTIGYQELPALEKMNISYRIPLPGVKQDGSRLRVVSPYPGLKIEISTDGGSTWRGGNKDMSLKPGQTILVSLTSTNGKRRSRAVRVKIPVSNQTRVSDSSAGSINISIYFIFLVYTLHIFSRTA